ncbi:MAG TPA: ABC transporter ATP-binding protein [Candidatus Atopostipes pullistercoris]|uniref:ABC transporter ATP-binding protein n=1 Tax=Candidatus Atopostipes pullistercoris TaxID=2838467 RepID=A0A9D2G2Z2_9LACT|nr:ABC transporter ATP-binding protein [Candidatus Atopostipes pullistercoris]
MSLKVSQLTGGYTRKAVIKEVSFEVGDGEIVGLIGLNGAGKSTTIKHIMGLMEPFSGEIQVDGLTLEKAPMDYRKKIAFVPETPMVYRNLTLKEHLEITAMAYNLPFEELLERAQPLLKLFRLDQRMDWFPDDFSKGMKQKVMITCAFVIQPSLFVIDEPFIGLDPVAMMDLENLLLEEKAKGNSILMSTHVLTNAEKVCDSFVILHDGHVFAKGTTDELAKTFHLKGADLEEIYRYVAQEEGFGHDA